MGRTTGRSGLRIGHLIGAVAVSALVMGLLKFPLDYALPMVSAAGFVMIGLCLVAAAIPADRRRSPGRSPDSSGLPSLMFLAIGVMVAVAAGVGFARSPFLVGPVVLGLAVLALGSAVALFVTWATGFRIPSADRADQFRRRFVRNLTVALILIAGSLAASILIERNRPIIPW